ncbi:MAG: hypothetical protein WA421_09000, partial [Nitrososphaeraceae archaeon]
MIVYARSAKGLVGFLDHFSREPVGQKSPPTTAKLPLECILSSSNGNTACACNDDFFYIFCKYRCCLLPKSTIKHSDT